jgi:hypothetical protein
MAPIVSTPIAATLWVSRVSGFKRDAMLSIFVSFNKEAYTDRSQHDVGGNVKFCVGAPLNAVAKSKNSACGMSGLNDGR